MKTPPRILALALAALVVAGGVGFADSPRASAKTFDLDVCDPINQGRMWWYDQDDDLGFGMARDCPVRMSIYGYRPSTTAGKMIWKLQPPQGTRDLTVSRVRYEGRGSDGSDAGARLGVEICGPSACGSLLTVSGPDVTDVEQVDSSGATGAVPPGANDVHLAMSCESPTCPAGRPLEMTHFTVTFDDPSPPQLTLPTPATGEIGQNQWVSKDAQLHFVADDPGGGIYRVEPIVSVIGRSTSWILSTSEYCGTKMAWLYRFCPVHIDSRVDVNVASAANLYAEGANTIWLRAYDEAGQGSESRAVSFKVDRVPPAAPAELAAHGPLSPNWTPDGDIRVTWSNPDKSASIYTESGVDAVEYDVDPLDVGQPDPPPARASGRWIDSLDVHLPTDGRWRLTLRTIDAAGNVGQAAGITLGRDDHVLAPPRMPRLDWVNAQFFVAGKPVDLIAPGDRAAAVSGICGYALSVNGVADADPGGQINVPGDVSSAQLPPSPPAGSQFMHARAINCAGVPGEVAHAPLNVDYTPPSVETEIIGMAAGWMGSDHGLRLQARDTGGSGVAKLFYRLDGAADSASVETADADPAIPQGDHVVEYFARDGAGNESPVESVSVHVDLTPPIALLDAPSASRPTVFKAFVSDGLSGIARAAIRAKPLGAPDSEWFNLAPFAEPQPGNIQSMVITARFPDTKVPPGQYELEVVAYDRVGNSNASQLRVDALPPVITLPLRSTPRLTLTAPGYRVPKSPCKAKIAGTLTGAGGAPIAGATVQLSEFFAFNRTTAALGTVTTAADGTFAATIPKGPNRMILAKYEQTETTLEVVAQGPKLLTQARVRLSASPRAARPGHSVVLSGRIMLASVGFATGAKRVDLQRLTRGGWKNLGGDALYANDRGEFSARLPLPAAPPGGDAYRLRAVVKMDNSDWGYLASASNPVRIAIMR